MICWKVSLVHQNKNFSIKEKTFVVHQEVLSNTGINWPHMEKLWINSSAASARVPHPSSFILCCLHSLGAEGEMDLQSALLTANTEWKTDLQGHWELLFQLKNTGLCLICCTRVQGISVKAGGADGDGTSSTTEVTPPEALGVWVLVGRLHSEVLAPGQEMTHPCCLC